MPRSFVQKATLLPAALIKKVEKANRKPGQNFKWSPYLEHLVRQDLERAEQGRSPGS